MNTLNIIAGGAAIVGVVLAGTMLLPRHIHVERQALLVAPSSAVLELAASNKGYQAFNPYKSTDSDLKIKHFGPQSGVGSGFHFDGKEGKGSQTVAEVTDTFVRYDIDLGAMGKPSQMISTQETESGLIVTWSMDADLGHNPIARVFGLFMDKMVGKSLENGLVNLKAATS